MTIKQLSPEHRRKIGEAVKKHPKSFQKGMIPWNKGISWKRKNPTKPFSEEWRAKLSEAHIGKPTWNKGIYGEKSHCWKGGRTDLVHRIRATDKYSQWRSDVFKRDGWTCQTCGLRGHGKDIHAHHIIPIHQSLKKIAIKSLNKEDKFLLALSIDEIFSVDNGVTLCANCHKLCHQKENNYE